LAITTLIKCSSTPLQNDRSRKLACAIHFYLLLANVFEMKKLLTKTYDWLGIETNDWNWGQMLFGKHYLGAIILIMIALYVC